VFWQVLKKGDVLMEFDGVVIANDGTVHFRARERIFFTSLITLKPTGSTAHVKVCCSSCSSSRARGSRGRGSSSNSQESTTRSCEYWLVSYCWLVL